MWSYSFLLTFRPLNYWPVLNFIWAPTISNGTMNTGSVIQIHHPIIGFTFFNHKISLIAPTWLIHNAHRLLKCQPKSHAVFRFSSRLLILKSVKWGIYFLFLLLFNMREFSIFCACHVGMLVSVFPEYHTKFPGSHLFFPGNHLPFQRVVAGPVYMCRSCKRVISCVLWLIEDWTNDRCKWISLNFRFYWENHTWKVYKCRIVVAVSC